MINYLKELSDFGIKSISDIDNKLSELGKQMETYKIETENLYTEISERLEKIENE